MEIQAIPSMVAQEVNMVPHTQAHTLAHQYHRLHLRGIAGIVKLRLNFILIEINAKDLGIDEIKITVIAFSAWKILKIMTHYVVFVKSNIL